jgi:hypothetical protein
VINEIKQQDFRMWNQARIAGAALALILQAPVAYAQSDNPAQTQTEQGAKPGANVPDEKLDKAAVAIGRVAALKQTYADRLENASEGERPQIMNEAKTALTQAVTDQGLSVEEYSDILQVAENDASVREKIIQRLRSKQQD